MNKIQPETWNRLTAVRGDGQSRDWMKEGEVFSQRTYMHDPWTWTMVWGLMVGMWGCEGSKGEKLAQL